MSVEPQKPQGTPTPPFIATAPALEALALLDRGLGAREPVVLVTGESGVGKSMLVAEALRRWGARVYARELSAGEATAETLFAALLGRFGGTENSQASGAALAQRLVEAIAHAANGGKVAMVVVEDAHTAGPDLLAQLVNVAEMMGRRSVAFEVLLVGTPELSVRLNDPALAALAAKVGCQVRVSPLTQHDTRHYLLLRSGLDLNSAAHGAESSPGLFSRKACRDIHGATFGITRAVEALADEAARRATKAGATTISPEHVRSAMQSLRARRGSSPALVIPPRSERASGVMPRPAVAKPAPAAPAPAAPANTAAAAPAPAAPTSANGSNGAPVRNEPPAKRPSAAPQPPRPPKPAAAKPAPAVSKAERQSAPKASAPQSAPKTAAPPTQAATPAAANGEQKFPGANDQRVKDWVSRFGGGAPIRIGVGHGVPRYEESATLDVPARSAGAAAEPTPPATPSRILIVDQEPQMPPELIARLNKVTGKKRRRRGPSATIQGAALAVAVAMLVVVLARQAGFGKHLGFDAADTSAHVATTPAPPPLALEAPGETGSKPKSATGSATAKSKRSEPVATTKKSSKASTRKVILTPSHAESLPPTSNRVASSTPVQTIVPPSEPPPSEDAPAGPGHKFGIIAGSFPNNDMAKAEKDHLARLVPYRVWIDKTKVQGQRSYQLMVGRFDTMEHAWDSAQVLMRRGLIRDANVRTLTEREAR